MSDIAVVSLPSNMRSGVESVMLNIVESLQERGDNVTILTPLKINIDNYNKYFNTNVIKSDIDIRRIAPQIRLLDAVSENRGFMIRRALVCRSVRDLHNEYDLVVSAINEIPLPEPECSIQYIHYPNFGRPEILNRPGSDSCIHSIYDSFNDQYTNTEISYA
ncbi:MAG: hypothetical protein ABEI86_05985, partial [Halobacteriaceae archaeon]